MATRPNIYSFAAYLGLTAPDDSGFSTADDDPMLGALNAALEYLEDRVDSGLIALKGYSLDPAGTTYPERLRTAVHMWANRLYKRRLSPEGVAGFGDQGAIRLMPQDSDVEALIEDLIHIGGFA